MVDERSPMWDVAAWTALGGGAAVGGARAHPAFRQALSSSSRDVAQETAARLRSMTGFNVGRLGGSIAPTDNATMYMLARLAETGGNTTVKSDIAAAAYEALLAGGRISQTEAHQIYKEIVTSGSVDAAYQQSAAAISKWQGNAKILTDRIAQLGQGGLYGSVLDPNKGVYLPTGRRDKMAQAIMSGTEFAGIQRQKMALSELGPDIRQEALNIQARLGKASGGRLGASEFYSIKDVIGGKEVATPFMRAKIGRETLNIPLANTGLTYGGEDLTSRYITRRSYKAGASDLQTYTQRYVNALEEAMAHQKTNTGLKNAVLDANAQMIESLRVEGSAARAQAVWTMPEAVLPSGGRARARMNVRQAVYAGAEDMTEGLRNRIIAETVGAGKGLYPYGSPDVVAKGTMMTKNVAEEIYGPAARLMGVEERPLQFIREQWGVTARAKEAATGFQGTFGEHFSRLERKIQGEGYQKLIHGGKSALAAEAYSAPQLMAFYAKPELLETGKLGEKMFQEEMLISNRVANAMEYERVVQKKISLDQGFKVNRGLLDALKGRAMGEVSMLENPIANGQFLGIERGTGRELWSEAGKAEAHVIAAELSGDNTATVYMRERHKLDRSSWWKFFSEDVKFMGRARRQRDIANMMATAGVGTDIIGGQTIEAIASGKLVERNRMALMNQQIEAMSVFLGQKVDTRSIRSRAGFNLARDMEVRSFLKDPSEFLKMDRLRGENIAQVERQIQENMVGLAKKYKFTPQEMGLTFGLMDSGVAKSLGIADAVSESRGVIGLSKMRLGDLASGGVGGLASFEQTGFRALAMKGEEGQRFAAELATRIRGKGEGVAADRMLASVIGAEDFTDRMRAIAGKADIDARTLSKFKSMDDLLRETGRYVDVGQKLEAFGGRSKLYIPGMGEAHNMFRTTLATSGKVIPSDVARNLDELRRLAVSGAGQEELEVAGRALRDQVVRAAEGQSAARGQIIGSRFLTGIRQTADVTDDTFRVSKRVGSQMFDDLIDRAKGADKIAYLKEQKRKLIEGGETLVGGVWRHPTTGPESFQFARYKVDTNLADEIISAPRRMGTYQQVDEAGRAIGRARQLDFSQMVGMKGDFDKDMFAISAISERDTAKRVAKNLDGSIQRGYTGYLFNHYAMKDMVDAGKNRTKALVELSRTEALQQGAKKLTTAKIATPQVNVALQKLKLGMQYAAPEKYRPMAELFWHMEEAAIGGKHGTMQSKLYQDIAHSVRQKDAVTMESVIKQLMGEKDRVISARITDPTGDIVTKTLRYSPKEYAQQAINAAAAVGEDVDYAYKAARTAKGMGISGDLNELVTMYYKRRTGSIDVAQSLMQAKDRGMEGFTQNVSRMLRQAAVKKNFIVKSLKGAKAPLLVGAALAAGVMLSAPSVSGVMPGKEGPAGGMNMNMTDMGPPAGMGMAPPQPRVMASPKAYDMSGVKMSSRANIRMSMPDANNSSVDFMRQASQLANGGKVRVRTTDDRAALNPHRLASKIHERL